MNSGQDRQPKRIDDALDASDVQGALRVFQALQTMVQSPQQPKDSLAGGSHLVRLAKHIHSRRAKRLEFFSPEIFGEPAWDILLSLYIAAGEQYRMKISAICNESGAPPTTALRWIERLLELGLARRQRNYLDQRSNFLELTEDGLERMERTLSSMTTDFQD